MKSLVRSYVYENSDPHQRMGYNVNKAIQESCQFSVYVLYIDRIKDYPFTASRLSMKPERSR